MLYTKLQPLAAAALGTLVVQQQHDVHRVVASLANCKQQQHFSDTAARGEGEIDGCRERLTQQVSGDALLHHLARPTPGECWPSEIWQERNDGSQGVLNLQDIWENLPHLQRKPVPGGGQGGDSFLGVVCWEGTAS